MTYLQTVTESKQKKTKRMKLYAGNNGKFMIL